MTTLYRPILIETAEQAEALPDGTPVLTVLTDPGEEERVVGADYIDDSFDEDLTPGGNFHHVALVPIEAEEQHITAKLMKDPTHPDGMRAFLIGETPADMTRLVTPWEEA